MREKRFRWQPYPDPYTPYPNQTGPGISTGSGSGLSGLINKASTAVAGLGLASGVTGLLGSLAGGGVSIHLYRDNACQPVPFFNLIFTNNFSKILLFFRFFNFLVRL